MDPKFAWIWIFEIWQFANIFYLTIIPATQHIVCVFSNSLVKTFLQSYEIIVIISIIYSQHLYGLYQSHYPLVIVQLEMIHTKKEVSYRPTAYVRKYIINNKWNNSCNIIFDYWNVWRSIWVKFYNTRWFLKIGNILRVQECVKLLSHYLVSFELLPLPKSFYKGV